VDRERGDGDGEEGKGRKRKRERERRLTERVESLREEHTEAAGDRYR
jgi:hypothetical protein